MRLPVLYSFLVPVPAGSHSGITHSINQLGGTYTLTHQIATNNSNSSLVPRSGFIAIDQSNRERTCSQNNKNNNSSCPQGRKKKPIKQSITAIRLLVPREDINQSINQTHQIAALVGFPVLPGLHLLGASSEGHVGVLLVIGAAAHRLISSQKQGFTRHKKALKYIYKCGYCLARR